MKHKILEKDIMKLVTDWLTMKRIYFVRMNTYSGKTQSGAWMRQGKKGMADILVIRSVSKGHSLIWLELKKPKGGIQSEAQKLFADSVRIEGHQYHIIRSLEDLEAAFK